MEQWFQIQHLDIERLLAEWRWLCRGRMTLVARTAFGDLFLADELGQISGLDVSMGKVEKVAESETEFRSLLQSTEKRGAWFAESEERGFAGNGLAPGETQCIGFYPPL